MNTSFPTRPGSRSICSPVAILFAILILAMSQLGGGSALSAPEQTGLTDHFTLRAIDLEEDSSRPTCMLLNACSFDNRGINLEDEEPVDTSVPACMALNACSFDGRGIEDVEYEDPIVVAHPTCMALNACSYLP